MNFDLKLREIESLIEEHKRFRADCLNLVASENTPSPLVEGLIVEELNRRYASYPGIDPQEQLYQGSRFIAEIETSAQELAKQLFGSSFVELRPLSGNVAGLIATFALCGPGDTVLEVHNAHRYADKLASSDLKVALRAILIPWDGVRSNIDLDLTVSLIRQHRPRIVLIGSAEFLFPQPVRELREAMDRYCPDSFLIYDAAHVLGLIAGGRFQSPLQEGADVMITSTHKTLAGPQGGMILTNDPSIAERMGRAIFPLMIANHHLARLPALAATFLEWLTFGPAHADAIITNAKALGRALHEQGVPLIGEELGFTESHTLLPIVDEFGEAKEVADRLEACHIITNSTTPPEERGRHGLRLGVQEVTRWGMRESDAPEIAGCIVDVLRKRDLEAVRERVIALARRFRQVRFTRGWDDQTSKRTNEQTNPG